jgi:hypothetical protein
MGEQRDCAAHTSRLAFLFDWAIACSFRSRRTFPQESLAHEREGNSTARLRDARRARFRRTVSPVALPPTSIFSQIVTMAGRSAIVRNDIDRPRGLGGIGIETHLFRKIPPTAGPPRKVSACHSPRPRLLRRHRRAHRLDRRLRPDVFDRDIIPGVAILVPQNDSLGIGVFADRAP